MTPAATLEAPAWTGGGTTPPRLLARPDKRDPAYLPTWDHGAEFLSDEHRAIAARVGDIEGLLRGEDAQKLYELAWFTPGPILEVGVFRGRSTTVMASALAAAGNPAPIVAVDVDGAGLAFAAATLSDRGLGGRVTLIEAEAAQLLERAGSLHPGLVFVDGDHTFRGASRDLTALEPIVPLGSIVVMHDYEGYAVEDPFWIQVAAAVDASWMGRDCAFLGRFGLSGVFLRRSGGPAPCDPSRPAPPTIQLARGSYRLRRARRWLRLAIDYQLRRRLARLWARLPMADDQGSRAAK